MSEETKPYRSVIGFYISHVEKTTKGGDYYAHVQVKDVLTNDRLSVTLWPSNYQKVQGSLEKGVVLLVEGPYEFKDGKYHNLVADNFNYLPAMGINTPVVETIGHLSNQSDDSSGYDDLF
jgi:DNA polymerase III alpha subunit